MSVLIDQGGFFVADTATVAGNVRIGKGSSIWFGAVLRGDMAPIIIGEYTNIQDLCVLHCDPDEELVIGNHVTIGHQAVVHGRKVGHNSLIGINSILLAGCEIGEGCIIGAGALIKEKAVIPSYSIVVGIPGKIIGKVDKAEVRDNIERAKRYYQTALSYIKPKA